MSTFPKYSRKLWKPICKFVIALVVILFAFWLALLAQENSFIQDLVYNFGYIGVLITSFISGLNIVVPIPIATFVPLFIESGLNFWITMLVVTVGVSLADSVAYVIGHSGRELVVTWGEKKLFKRLDWINTRFPRTPLILLFVYVILIPFPNELLIIPLAIMGYPFSRVFPIYLAGNFIFTLGSSAIILGVFGLF